MSPWHAIVDKILQATEGWDDDDDTIQPIEHHAIFVRFFYLFFFYFLLLSSDIDLFSSVCSKLLFYLSVEHHFYQQKHIVIVGTSFKLDSPQHRCHKLTTLHHPPGQMSAIIAYFYHQFLSENVDIWLSCTHVFITMTESLIKSYMHESIAKGKEMYFKTEERQVYLFSEKFINCY